MRLTIDINCDIGERGIDGIDADLALLPFVSSVNIACGGHAGDPVTMAAIVEQAMARGIAVGAHPGLNDRANFGRNPAPMTFRQAYDLVAEQTQLLATIGNAAGYKGPYHIKPHGALYHMAEHDDDIARAVVHAGERALVLFGVYGLAGGKLVAQARAFPFVTVVAEEVFADRAYLPNGELAPRPMEGAVLADPDAAVKRLRHWLETGQMTTIDGQTIALAGDTVCVHSDSTAALETAQAIHEELATMGITVRAPAHNSGAV